MKITNTNKRYTLNQIKLIVESGKADKVPAFDRNKMRYILHSNIEALDYYSKNEKLPPEIRDKHREQASKLKSFLNKIPSSNKRRDENTNNKTARYSNSKVVY